MQVDYKMECDHVDPVEYDTLMRRIREFFAKKNYIECFLGSKLDTLSACEDAENLATFHFMGKKYSLVQSGQVNLERTILKDDQHRSYCCHTTSFREEKNPIPGRHNFVYPLWEWESNYDFSGLIQFHKELLEHLGFGDPSTYVDVEYTDMLKKYGVDEISHVEERKMYEDYGPVIFLKFFDSQSSPFWNMRRLNKDLAYKCDVILAGNETIGSAERSCDAEQMRNSFHTISDGKYAEFLYEKFGKERIENELEEYLALPFRTRSGAGLGITRMLTACKTLGIL